MILQNRKQTKKDERFVKNCVHIVSLLSSHLSRSLVDRWGTTVDITTSFLHSSRFSAFRSMIFHWTTTSFLHSSRFSAFLGMIIHWRPVQWNTILRKAENREEWKKLVVKSTVVPQWSAHSLQLYKGKQITAEANWFILRYTVLILTFQYYASHFVFYGMNVKWAEQWCYCCILVRKIVFEK